MEEYSSLVDKIQTSNDPDEIELTVKHLIKLRENIEEYNPQFIDSIVDIDFWIACGAYRVNDSRKIEQTVQKHHNDSRFKYLYHKFWNMEITNSWQQIIKNNSDNLQKTFVRTISVFLLTGVCLSLAFRK